MVGDLEPAGHGHLGDAGAVQTVAELKRALGWLRGARSYAALDRSAAGALPKSTLSSLLNGGTVPTRATVEIFLTACGLDDDARLPWLAAWERAATAHLRRPAGAVRVREARPRLLGVHASIKVAGADGDLPVYVPRDLDADLRTAIAVASTHGGFVVLLGGSSAGKTRAMYEAVRAVLPEWWLVHPDHLDPEAIRSLASTPTPRTVLWLDELQRYIAGGLTAGAVRALIGARTVLLATQWPGDAGDAVLGLAHVIDVPDTLSARERRRGEALAGDPRIRVALDSPDGGFTQVLAAGPQLIRWWENAPAAECYGQAVITAALDARRVGATAPLSRSLLQAAAPGYLTPAEQARAAPEWFESALAYATTPLHGASAALSPVPAGMGRVAGYTIADYLDQHARTVRRTARLPDCAWRALVDHHDPGDTLRLADEAERRGRPAEAIDLFRRVADAGVGPHASYAANHLAHLLADRGRLEELRERTAAGDGEAAVRLAGMLDARGDAEEAIGLLDGKTSVDNMTAPFRLVEMLAGQDRVDDLRARVDAGDWHANMVLADLLMAEGRIDDLRELANSCGGAAEVRLAWWLAERGLIDELRERADLGYETATTELADLLVAEEAIARLRRLADAGSWNARRRLLDLLVEQGRAGAAIAILRGLVDAGDDGEVINLAQLLAVHGDIEEALTILRGRVDEFGERAAEHQLAGLLAATGRVDELSARAGAGDAEAVIRLADVLVERGHVEEGIAALREFSYTIDPWVTKRLTELLVEHGRTEDAIANLRGLADRGVYHAAQRLSELLVTQDRMDDLQNEVAAGTIGAAVRLEKLARQRAALDDDLWDLDGPQ